MTDRVERAIALAKVAAAVAVGARRVTHEAVVADALACGASSQDVIATLVAVAPVVGSARIVAATPHVASAAGYDIDHAIEAAD